MGLGLQLARTVSIQNQGLVGIHYAVQLLIIGWLVRSWFAQKGGTSELLVTSQASFQTLSSSSNSADDFDPTRDQLCSHIDKLDWELHAGAKVVCTSLMIETCPRERDLDMCTDLYEAESVNSPFDMKFRVSESEVVSTHRDLDLNATAEFVDTQRTPFEFTIRYNAFIQKFVINLSYQFVVGMNAPTNSALGLNDNLRMTGSNRHAKTVLLDKDGLPAQIYEPGEDIILKVPRLLQLMQSSFGNIQPVRDIFGLFEEMQLPGNEVTFPSWIWDQGATLYFVVTCYSDDHDVKQAVGSKAASSQHSNEAVWDLGASQRMPVCFVTVVLAQPKSESQLLIEKKEGLTKRRSMTNIHIVSKTGSGFFRAFDIMAGVVFVSMALVLLGLPKRFMRFFALNCLGQLSRIYSSVAAPKFDVPYVCAKAVVQLVSQSVSFVELADQTSLDGILYGGISWRRMLERVSAIVRHRRAELDDSEVQVLADFAFRQARQGTQTSQNSLADIFQFASFLTGRSSTEDQSDLKETTLDIDNFCHVTGSEAIDIDTIAKLFDRDRRPSILERLFTPRHLWRRIHVDRQVRADKESIQKSESEEQQELQVAVANVDVDSLPLESRKSAAAQATKEAGQVNRLRQEVTSLTKELTNMRRLIEDLQAALLRETEKHSAAEAVLRGELSMSMQDVQAAVAGIASKEAERQREAGVVLNICKEVREYGGMLQREIASITSHSLQEVTMAGSATASKELVMAAENSDAEQKLASAAITRGHQLVAQDCSALSQSQTDAAQGPGQPLRRARGSAKCSLRTALSLQTAVQNLASSHAHLLQVVSDLASRMESIDRRIDVELGRPHTATENQLNQGGSDGSRWNAFMRRFQRGPEERQGMQSGASHQSRPKDAPRAKAAVVQCAVADPSQPTATTTGHAVADPTPTTGVTDEIDIPPKATQPVVADI